jgi:hypothetical protein
MTSQAGGVISTCKMNGRSFLSPLLVALGVFKYPCGIGMIGGGKL